MADNTFNAPLSPIQRSTPSQNILSFSRNEYSIYNKFTPYYQAGGQFGFDQPYVYTKLTDSNLSKNLTRFDTQALPIGSTVRDVVRMTKFSASTPGVIYLGKQLLLQQQNPFNETRVYNPLSLLKATARPTSLGAIGYPQRHLETSGGLLNFFKDALLSTFGFSTRDSEKSKIEGTASGALANYVAKRGGAKYGLMRFNTGNEANTRFKSLWGVGQAGGQSGGIQKSLINRLLSFIPSTNPLGAYAKNQFGQTNTADPWKYRPEYDSAYQEGIYFSYREDRFGLMTTTVKSPSKFYNDPENDASDTLQRTPKDFHKYTPGKTQTAFGEDDPSNYYVRLNWGGGDLDNNIGNGSNLKSKYESMLAAVQAYNNVKPQNRKSTEGYNNDIDKGINEKTNYAAIPGNGKVEKSTITNGPFLQTLADNQEINDLRIDNRGFSKTDIKMDGFGQEDIYNTLEPIKKEGDTDPAELHLRDGSDQSADLIFFYFYDLVNKVYIPFRATLTSIQDNYSPDWEEIKYMGRADKLFIYKGFGRDVNFNFRVYANSIQELDPMWKRVNYLTGLVRPSKYTARASVTNETAAGETSGNESGFIYPPMIEFRVGDLFVDQPAVIRSLGVTVPDDATWETLRGDTYTYAYGVDKVLSKAATVKQLPNIIDISISMTLLERNKSITNENHYGPQTEDAGWQMKTTFA